MPMHISPSDESVLQETAQSVMKRAALYKSPIQDVDNRMNREAKAEAFAKRYGKKVNVDCSYGLTEQKNAFTEYTIIFESLKGYHYSITDFIKNDVTDYVLLCYRTKDGRNIENKFNRFVDAEVTLADLISEEV